jgi:hypothetical protein
MSTIADLCEKIVGQLTAMGSPVANFLHPGLSNQDIQGVQASLPFVFPISVVEMYKWRNGTALVPGSTFFPWWVFDTIAESVERYNVLSAPRDELWNDHWFPIFSASDVSSIGICCKNSPKEDGEIYCFEYSLGTQIEFITLEAMLRTILAAYETGAIFLTSGGLEQDDDAFARLARQFNPGIQRWAE